MRAIICDNCGGIAAKQKGVGRPMVAPMAVLMPENFRTKSLCVNCAKSVTDALKKRKSESENKNVSK